MKAYQIQTAAGIDGLKLVDLPEPKPVAGQVLVRVRATSLNLFGYIPRPLGRINPDPHNLRSSQKYQIGLTVARLSSAAIGSLKSLLNNDFRKIFRTFPKIAFYGQV